MIFEIFNTLVYAYVISNHIWRIKSLIDGVNSISQQQYIKMTIGIITVTAYTLQDKIKLIKNLIIYLEVYLNIRKLLK